MSASISPRVAEAVAALRTFGKINRATAARLLASWEGRHQLTASDIKIILRSFGGAR